MTYFSDTPREGPSTKYLLTTFAMFQITLVAMFLIHYLPCFTHGICYASNTLFAFLVYELMDFIGFGSQNMVP